MVRSKPTQKIVQIITSDKVAQNSAADADIDEDFSIIAGLSRGPTSYLDGIKKCLGCSGGQAIYEPHEQITARIEATIDTLINEFAEAWTHSHGIGHAIIAFLASSR